MSAGERLAGQCLAGQLHRATVATAGQERRRDAEIVSGREAPLMECGRVTAQTRRSGRPANVCVCEGRGSQAVVARTTRGGETWRSFSDACGVSCRVRAGKSPGHLGGFTPRPSSALQINEEGGRSRTWVPHSCPAGFESEPGTGQDSAVSARRSPRGKRSEHTTRADRSSTPSTGSQSAHESRGTVREL
jgi:hypothetical protein